MLAKRLEIEGLYSFGTGEHRLILDLHDRVTVVVGPNGAGKSSIARVLDLLKAAVAYNDATGQQERQGLYPLLQGSAMNARHRGMTPVDRASIRFSYELTTSWERHLLCSYVQAAVFSAVVGNQGN
ncbi:MAG: AAA family ATPase, partial [Acidimicrobiales bacterium]